MPELLKCFCISNYFAWLWVFTKLLSLENAVWDHAGKAQTQILSLSPNLSVAFGWDPWNLSRAPQCWGNELEGGVCWALGRCWASPALPVPSLRLLHLLITGQDQAAGGENNPTPCKQLQMYYMLRHCALCRLAQWIRNLRMISVHTFMSDGLIF